MRTSDFEETTRCAPWENHSTISFGGVRTCFNFNWKMNIQTKRCAFFCMIG